VIALTWKEKSCMRSLDRDDPVVASLVDRESSRVEATLDMIAAENYPPRSVMEAQGSVFTIKTIEGYPGRRYHAGCVFADQIEDLAVTRAKELFGAEHVNVQPHSGTSANLAVYFSVLEVGDRVLAMSLPHGGHLSHGHRASITSRCFAFSHYTTDRRTGLIDYDDVRRIAEKTRPRMIVAGASSYPRLIDYRQMADIARDVSAFLFADMAHLAGLVAAKVIPSPVSHCDFISFSCYKTMKGGRGGVIMCRKQYADQVDSAVFPGTQGTTPMSSLAAKAVMFRLAATPEFVETQKRTVADAKELARTLAGQGYGIVSGGTDNHQVLVDLSPTGMSGKQAEEILESVGILANRNVIPRDADSPGKASGLRLGAQALAARGMDPEQMRTVAALMDRTLRNKGDRSVLDEAAAEVKALAERFPVYGPEAR
jgi:glycine hydroxymethyltransferase